jgi:hypothetical protein
LVWRWWICYSSPYRWEAEDLDLRQHGDVPRSTCHNDMCHAACSGSVKRRKMDEAKRGRILYRCHGTDQCQV